jgi:purine-nucleoside phosphorylase
MDLLKEVQTTANYLKQFMTTQPPKVAIILGSGLGPLAEEVTDAKIIPYQNIPNFKVPKIVGHSGELVIGKLSGVEVVVQKGRWHFYEGYSLNEVVLPVRVYKELGIENIIITNAAGGVNQSFNVSDLMLITDHLNLMGANPLMGPAGKLFGTQFPDMSQVYDLSLRNIALAVAKAQNLNLQTGVYGALTGPSYETPAEIRMLRTLGADAVGMSTVPEAISARHRGMKVLGISCITNMAAGVTDQTLSHEEVKLAADQSMSKFINLLTGIVQKI